jgi:hypothetical protein
MPSILPMPPAPCNRSVGDPDLTVPPRMTEGSGSIPINPLHMAPAVAVWRKSAPTRVRRPPLGACHPAVHGSQQHRRVRE